MKPSHDSVVLSIRVPTVVKLIIERQAKEANLTVSKYLKLKVAEVCNIRYIPEQWVTGLYTKADSFIKED